MTTGGEVVVAVAATVAGTLEISRNNPEKAGTTTAVATTITTIAATTAATTAIL